MSMPISPRFFRTPQKISDLRNSCPAGGKERWEVDDSDFKSSRGG